MPAAATNEYAVMIDARDALKIGRAAKPVELQPYAQPWRKSGNPKAAQACEVNL
jgi:homogentisate 1,2-dioxygenase